MYYDMQLEKANPEKANFLRRAGLHYICLEYEGKDIKWTVEENSDPENFIRDYKVLGPRQFDFKTFSRYHARGIQIPRNYDEKADGPYFDSKLIDLLMLLWPGDFDKQLKIMNEK